MGLPGVPDGDDALRGRLRGQSAKPPIHQLDAAAGRARPRREHLERRVYPRDTDGPIVSGMPASIGLWATMPGYRGLLELLTLALLRPVSTILYDHVVAPSLAFWATRCAVRAQSARHGWF